MPDNSVCVFTTLRASLEDTLAFAYYHLNIGVDHMFLFFDDPQDPAIAELAQERRVTCIHCDAKYWEELASELSQFDLNLNAKQEINSQVAIKMAREQGYDWICQIDSDELIHTPEGLKWTLAGLPPQVQVARLPVLEAIPEKLSVHSPFRELHHFKHAKMPPLKKEAAILSLGDLVRFRIDDILYRLKRRRATLLGYKNVYNHFTKGHRMGKSIGRTNAADRWHPHYPLPAGQEPLRTVFLSRAKLLHYDAQDYEHWKTKWALRYKQTQNGQVSFVAGIFRNQQYAEFAKAYGQGNEDDLVALFRSTYFVSPAELAVLKKVGLVSEIHLLDPLFEKPLDPDRQGLKFG